ncbi:AAA family ATPase [Novosphingobium sp. PhB165]|uniref:AAA family ATPase n=1 Tax=Novosphingobium sp. PhB165 TaxID=2485105 RepID=UPI001404448D|nr:AAA family ATPase [Novosphingobium sp. PhB165]
MSILFKNISLRNWRQFEHVSIDVHPKLTIITGSNGAGKSSILNMFSKHFGYSRPFLSTPRKTKSGISYDLGYNYSDPPFYLDDGEFDRGGGDEFDEYLPKFVRSGDPLSFAAHIAAPTNGQFVEIGKINYNNGVSGSLGFHEQQVNQFDIAINNQQNVLGVPITSHRVVSHYQPVQALSFQSAGLSNAYNQYVGEIYNRLNGGHTQYTPFYRMKETLIAMAAFGEGNSHLEPNPALLTAFEGFNSILRKVLPKEIGFQKMSVRPPDVVIKSRTGEFILDSSSGGVSAIIEIAWQIYLFSLSNETFVITIDEPENHLHPSMQRSLLANLISAFPKAQFIVATHSPFIVSAVEDSNVYALKYTDPATENGFPSSTVRRVRSIALDQSRKAGTASEILDEVLGVNAGIPPWAQGRFEDIVKRYEAESVSRETLSRLRADLNSAGFSEFYPEALSRLVGDQ